MRFKPATLRSRVQHSTNWAISAQLFVAALLLLFYVFLKGMCQKISRQQTSSPKGNDAHLRAIIQSEKKWKDQFFRRLRAANSVVYGQIRPNFKLIEALMYVIITCKYEKDPIKNNREKGATPVFQIITLSVAMETTRRIRPNF